MKRFKFTIIIIIMSITFLCLIVYFSNREKISFMKNGVGYKISDSFQFIKNISKVKKENDELRKTNSKLQNKAIEYDGALKQNEIIGKMLKFSNKRPNYNYMGAYIIGISENSDGFIINVGENKGIKKGMTAMSGDGLIGQVSSVGNKSSIVRFLSNENIAVAAIVEGTSDTDGIVKYYKNENNKVLAEMQQLSINSDIKKGDVIVTSGLGGIYPSGIKIGKVLTVQENKGEVTKTAIVEPFVDFSKIQEVFIVISKDPSGIKY